VRAGLALATIGLSLQLGCGGGEEEPVCATDEGELVPGLACEAARAAESWIERLAARPLDAVAQQRLMTALQAQATRDPEAVGAALVAARAEDETMRDAPRGQDAAQARAHANWVAHRGGGPFPKDRWPTVDSVRDGIVAVWATSDEDELALTEMDVEGWIRFASLCREVQGGTPLKMSIADRVPAYRAVTDRFSAGPTADRLGIVSLGGGWGFLSRTWHSAAYARQQSWIRTAPLPGPMTTNSLGYLRAITAGSPAAHMAAVEMTLGPVPTVEP